MRRDGRTIFVGDVHGCCAELDALLAKVEYVPGRDRLLLTGDAFTRGPDPLGVWRRIRGSSAEMVMGNHDDALLAQLRTLAAGGDPKPAHGDRTETLRVLAPQGEELIAWLAALPLFIEEREFLLVHAGIDPERGVAGTSRDQFLTIRTWPPDGGITGPRWHEHLDECYRVPGRPIIIGHDAPQGLLIKHFPEAGNGVRPGLIALDSGCVFGNALSAYVLEEDRIVQVPAQRRWITKGSFSYIPRGVRSPVDLQRKCPDA